MQKGAWKTPVPLSQLVHPNPHLENTVLVFLLGMLFGVIVLIGVDWIWPTTLDPLWP